MAMYVTMLGRFPPGPTLRHTWLSAPRHKNVVKYLVEYQMAASKVAPTPLGDCTVGDLKKMMKRRRRRMIMRRRMRRSRKRNMTTLTLRASGSFRRPFSLCFEPSGVSRITCPDGEQVSEAAFVLFGLKAHTFLACILTHIFRGFPVAFLTRLSLHREVLGVTHPWCDSSLLSRTQVFPSPYNGARTHARFNLLQ